MESKQIKAFHLPISAHVTACTVDKDAKNNVDIAVFDELIEFLAKRNYNMVVLDLGDGVKWNSHPEIATKDAWTVEFLKEKLQFIRSKGMEVIPELNFSMAHAAWQKEWRYGVYLPEYMPFCRDLIREACEIFDRPRFFHLGLDSEKAEMQKNLDIVYVRNSKVVWRQVKELFDEVEKQGSRPWIFSDFYKDHPTGFLANVPKNVIQSNHSYFLYDTRKFYRDGRENPYYEDTKVFEDLNEAGYDQIPLFSTVRFWANAMRGIRYCQRTLDANHILGYIEASWHNVTRKEKYLLMNDADILFRAVEAYPPEK